MNHHRSFWRNAGSCLSLAALVFFSPAIVKAAAPMLEKVDIFQADSDGYKLYRIPGIVVTTKGTILAYCEARKFTGGDWDTIDVMLRRSTDGGKTWQPRQLLSDVPGPKPRPAEAVENKIGKPDDVTFNNPVAIVDRDTGSIHFLFCLNYSRCFYTRSDDDGATFTKPVEITSSFDGFRPAYDWHVLATGPGHGIQLKNGRLLVPVWLSPAHAAHHPSCAATIFSDDHGKTWHTGDIAVPDTKEFVHPNETCVVQLSDGRVMLNSRTISKPNQRVITISPNGATDWTPSRFDENLPDPICMASIVRLSEKPSSDKNRILFSNPDNLKRADGKEKPGGGRDRKNVSVRLSYDEGASWPLKKSLEPGVSGYSDLAVMPDGTILCFYERASESGANHYMTRALTVARFNLEWLTDGKDTLGK